MTVRQEGEIPYHLGLKEAPYFRRGASPDGKIRICIATGDIVGPIRNGGIGTAYTYLAQFLVKHGFKVTILYALGVHCESGTIEYWIEHYRRQGIEFVPLDKRYFNDLREGYLIRQIRYSYGLMNWLRENHFDIVHVSEWRGLGYYPMLLKRLGLGLEDTHFVVKCSSPTWWSRTGGHQPFDELADMVIAELEKRSVEWADVAISGSAHLLDWMLEHGYRLPPQRFAQKNILPLPQEQLPEASAKRLPIQDIVFFGRLEPRKGIELFGEALTFFRQSDVRPRKVYFMGKRARSFDFDAFAAKHAPNWDFEWEVIENLSQPEAISFLTSGSKLAVMPSILENSSFCIYECLSYGIPFVASSTGGNPELVAEADRDRVLFPLIPSRIYGKMATALREGLQATKPSFDFAENEAIWRDWHASLATQIRSRSTATSRVEPTAHDPRVSVCITHYNRTKLLRRALQSLRAQSYRNFEVIIVDDGSYLPEVLTDLADIEEEIATLGWRVIRQENAYLGAARNRAAAAATGDYLLFMDDDNIALPEEIATFVSAALTSNADILTSFHYQFDATLDPTQVQVPLHVVPFLGGSLSTGLFLNSFGDANALVRKSIFEEMGGFTEDYGLAQEDHEFFARAVMRRYELYVIPLPLYWYSWSDQSMMRTAHPSASQLRVSRAYSAHYGPEIGHLFSFVQALLRERMERRSDLKAMRRELLKLKGQLDMIGKVLNTESEKQS